MKDLVIIFNEGLNEVGVTEEVSARGRERQP